MSELNQRTRELIDTAALAAYDKLAKDVLAFDVSERLAITDAFLLATGSNEPQVQAIVEAVEEKLLELGAKPVRREGHKDGRWVLLDFVDIVVHVQHADEREYYGLERLWRDCPLIELPDPRPAEAEDGAATQTAGAEPN